MTDRGRPPKENPRNDFIRFRAAEEDVQFVTQVSEADNLTPSSAAWKIFQCGKRFYFAECSQKNATIDAPNSEINL